MGRLRSGEPVVGARQTGRGSGLQWHRVQRLSLAPGKRRLRRDMELVEGAPHMGQQNVFGVRQMLPLLALLAAPIKLCDPGRVITFLINQA
jgi:hypothetical protein